MYDRLAHYFKTHFPYAKGPAVPLTTACSGEGTARYFGKEEARKRIDNRENIIWTSTMSHISDLFHYYDDSMIEEFELIFFYEYSLGLSSFEGAL